jgi:Rhodopirellula transposase DDE domain
VGVSHETAEFAVDLIRRWWRTESRAAYLNQTELLIQADGGGANGYRDWPWKWELQRLADETGLTIPLTHYTTSASKWNWIEHRLFCHISANWAGEPLVRYETVLKCIQTTKTEAAIRLIKHRVLPKWNYTMATFAFSS